MADQKRILVAPLNWGLGHATRCIPVIRSLLDFGALVHLASDGASKLLLQKEFPDLPIHDLPGYNINYGKKGLMFTMAAQVPKLLRAIRKEHQATSTIVDEYNLNGIISDNRYGCYSEFVQSIIISHQINIRLPLKLMEKNVRLLNRRWISKFDDCWIPDYEGVPNLSGELGHNTGLETCTYIGPLSRMKKMKSEKEFDLSVILSGPEPQRTILEERLTDELADHDASSILVRGVPGEQNKVSRKGNLMVVDYMKSNEVNELISKSKLVIARSGYSTVMDMVKSGARAIFIPTPGQTEQEYLAEILSQQGYFGCISQDEVNLGSILELSQQSFEKFPYRDSADRLETVIGRWLETL